VLFCALPALAQTEPPLGVAGQFGALGNSGVTGSTTAGTAIDGDVGSSPTASITNFPPSTVVAPFTLHMTNDVTVQQAQTDANAAYVALASQGPGTVLAAQLDGAIITSGIYSFSGGAADLAALGTLTLNGPGIFVFQVDSALTANVNSNVIGSADPCNVFWRVGTSATLNGVIFWGTVIADASITVGDGATVTGRTLAGTGPTGAVTMAGDGGNTIGGCSRPEVTVTKTSLTTTVLAAGALVTYTFTVENTGQVAFDITSLEDDQFGTLTGDGDCQVGTTLDPGDSCDFAAAFAVPAGMDGDTFVNVFTAEVEADSGATDSDSDDHTVTYTNVAVPDVTVTKSSATTDVPESGDIVTYTFTVGNTGPVDFTITSLDDDQFGTLVGDGDCQLGTVLLPGASCNFQAAFAVPAGTAGATFVNIFTTDVMDALGAPDTDSDDHTVTYFVQQLPVIEIPTTSGIGLLLMLVILAGAGVWFARR
jgi:hypothetical protein